MRILPGPLAAGREGRYDGPSMTTRTPEAPPRQRWQLLFSRREPALRMRQAQLVEELERAFKEASLPLSYTRALKPRPRIKLAA